MDRSDRPFVVAISGASGALYGLTLVERLLEKGVAVHLIVSRRGTRIVEQETGRALDRWLERLLEVGALTVYANDDFDAPSASGSNLSRGMVVAPCSMGTLGRIAGGVSSSLIERSADVCLKERRPLVLLARETPLSVIHLENMLTIARAGGIVMPPVPALYSRPATVGEIVERTVERVLDLLEVPNDAAYRWKPEK